MVQWGQAQYAFMTVRPLPFLRNCRRENRDCCSGLKYGDKEKVQVNECKNVPLNITKISLDVMILLSKKFIERNILKFYKVQPLIMLSHNQNLELHHFPLQLSLTFDMNMCYELRDALHWPAQYCKPMVSPRLQGRSRRWAIFKTFVRVFLGHHTSQYFSAECVYGTPLLTARALKRK